MKKKHLLVGAILAAVLLLIGFFIGKGESGSNAHF